MPPKIIEYMLKSDVEKIVYNKHVLDFVTIAVEVCAFLEDETSLPRDKWVDRLLKMLPLLYVKALLLPDTDPMEEDPLATFVREVDYSRVTNKVTEIMGEEDVFLEVFLEDMKYSETPVTTFISESIADIYQDIRDFVSIYQFGLEAQMNDAICQCKENFRLFWGQKLVNVLRPLHAVLFASMDGEEDGMNLSEDESWD